MKIFSLDEGNDSSQLNNRYCETASGVGQLNGIECLHIPKGCGQTWAGGGRIYKELPQDHELRLKPPYPISPDEMQQKVLEIRQLLNLPNTTKVFPGTAIGSFHLTKLHNRLVDVSSPILCSLIVSEQFIDFLNKGNYTGWRAENVTWASQIPETPLPKVYELAIEGEAISKTCPERKLVSHCIVCGRDEFSSPHLDTFELDASKWDGSDLFRFTNIFQGHIWVTERLENDLLTSNLTNVNLQSVGDVLSFHNKFRSKKYD